MRIKLKFKLAEMWVGLRWQLRLDCDRFDIYICLLPCLPIHIMMDRAWVEDKQYNPWNWYEVILLRRRVKKTWRKYRHSWGGKA